MGENKILVVFYSRSGKTRKVAEELSNLLKSDLEEVIDNKKRSGILGFLGAGKDAFLRRLTDIGEPNTNPSSYETVIFGTPVWAGKISPAIRTYIEKFKSSLRKVGLFCTCGGGGHGQKAFLEMEKISGKTAVATMEIVSKELAEDKYAEKLNSFAAKLS